MGAIRLIRTQIAPMGRSYKSAGNTSKVAQSDKHKEAIVEAVQAKVGGDAADIKRWLNSYLTTLKRHTTIISDWLLCHPNWTASAWSCLDDTAGV